MMKMLSLLIASALVFASSAPSAEQIEAVLKELKKDNFLRRFDDILTTFSKNPDKKTSYELIKETASKMFDQFSWMKDNCGADRRRIDQNLTRYKENEGQGPEHHTLLSYCCYAKLNLPLTVVKENSTILHEYLSDKVDIEGVATMLVSAKAKGDGLSGQSEQIESVKAVHDAGDGTSGASKVCLSIIAAVVVIGFLMN